MTQFIYIRKQRDNFALHLLAIKIFIGHSSMKTADIHHPIAFLTCLQSFLFCTQGNEGFLCLNSQDYIEFITVLGLFSIKQSFKCKIAGNSEEKPDSALGNNTKYYISNTAAAAPCLSFSAHLFSKANGNLTLSKLPEGESRHLLWIKRTN